MALMASSDSARILGLGSGPHPVAAGLPGRVARDPCDGNPARSMS